MSEVDKVAVITDEMGEIVGELGAMMQTFSPAFTVSDQFRRQLERLRRGGNPANDGQFGRGATSIRPRG